VKEAGRRGFPGNGAHPIEQIGLPSRAREVERSVAPIADEAQMDLLAKGQARGHSVLQAIRAETGSRILCEQTAHATSLSQIGPAVTYLQKLADEKSTLHCRLLSGLFRFYPY
jgi:hypothetical protein